MEQLRDRPRGQLLLGSSRVYCCSMLKNGSLAEACLMTAAQGALLFVECGRMS